MSHLQRIYLSLQTQDVGTVHFIQLAHVAKLTPAVRRQHIVIYLADLLVSPDKVLTRLIFVSVRYHLAEEVLLRLALVERKLHV